MPPTAHPRRVHPRRVHPRQVCRSDARPCCTRQKEEPPDDVRGVNTKWTMEALPWVMALSRVIDQTQPRVCFMRRLVLEEILRKHNDERRKNSSVFVRGLGICSIPERLRFSLPLSLSLSRSYMLSFRVVPCISYVNIPYLPFLSIDRFSLISVNSFPFERLLETKQLC